MPAAVASRCAAAPTSATTTCAALIVAKELKSIPEVMQELEWKTLVRLRQRAGRR